MTPIQATHVIKLQKQMNKWLLTIMNYRNIRNNPNFNQKKMNDHQKILDTGNLFMYQRRGMQNYVLKCVKGLFPENMPYTDHLWM